MTAQAAYLQRGSRSYFSIASAVLLLLTLLGFSDNLLTNVGQPSNRDLKFILHGLFCLGWMLAIFVQANLVRGGNVRLHRRLGMTLFPVAVGVTLSTLYVFWAVDRRWDSLPVEGQANRLLLPGFAILVLLGFLHRVRPDRHKRLLFLASLYMMEPVLSRAFDPFEPMMTGIAAPDIDRAWWVFFVIAWNGLFVSLAAYDWLTIRRVHPVTAVGYGAFALMWLLALLV